MSLFLILLAAGNSKRLKSNTPKPFHIVNNKTLLEHSFDAFNDFNEIKKTIVVYNNKHEKYLNALNECSNNVLLLTIWNGLGVLDLSLLLSPAANIMRNKLISFQFALYLL